MMESWVPKIERLEREIKATRPLVEPMFTDPLVKRIELRLEQIATLLAMDQGIHLDDRSD